MLHGFECETVQHEVVASPGSALQIRDLLQNDGDVPGDAVVETAVRPQNGREDKMDDTMELLRPADIAPSLGVGTGRVYQLIAEGVTPAVRVGGSLRIPRAAWQQWLAHQRDRAMSTVRADGRV
jgi:excisionase family DNA binding protein